MNEEAMQSSDNDDDSSSSGDSALYYQFDSADEKNDDHFELDSLTTKASNVQQSIHFSNKTNEKLPMIVDITP